MQVPPVFLVMSLLLMAFLGYTFPLAELIDVPYRYAGLVIAALAVMLALWAVVHFRRAGTSIHPHRPPLALVTAGPYRFTRNPMYLAMSGILLGVAIYLGSLTPFIVIPAFMALISERFIEPEEAKLEAAFGPAYLEYKSKVRRWL